MGYSTLRGSHDMPLADRLRLEFGAATVERLETVGDAAMAHAHALVNTGPRVVWVVAIIESGMCKLLDETSGPYCSAPSREFYEEALRLCGEPEHFAAGFRSRMAALLRAEEARGVCEHAGWWQVEGEDRALGAQGVGEPFTITVQASTWDDARKAAIRLRGAARDHVHIRKAVPAAKPPPLEWRRALVMSTIHLRPETRERLSELPLDLWPAAGAPIPHGFYIYAHDEDGAGEIEAFAPELWGALMFARHVGADYVQFDCDAEPTEGLPTFADE